MGRTEMADRPERVAGDRVAGAWRSRWRARALCAALAIGGAALAAAPATLLAAQPPEAAQDGFLPMDEIPPEDRLPAAPLLVAAYASVWALTIGYLWTIWRRLGLVERELADVTRRVRDRERSRE